MNYGTVMLIINMGRYDMKRILLFFLLMGVCILFLNATVLAASATIDTNNVANGIVTVNLTDFEGKIIKAQVEKGSEKYLYTLVKSLVNLPLQMGTGEYKVTVLENVGGDKYMPLATQNINANKINEKEMYKASIPMIEYSVSITAIPGFKEITSKKTTDSDKLDALYNEIVNNYSYDFDKANSVKSDYVPIIDNIYAAKKGICYDYAAILGGALRSQGIPTRLVMGYVPEITSYHAWNEVYINNEWIAVDATYDAQVVKAGISYSMKKDISKTKVIKIY